MSLLRRLSIVVVTVVGVGAVTATSAVDEPRFDVVSPDKNIGLVLDEGTPEARFLVDITSTVVDGDALTLRADINVDDDLDPETDGATVVDVGLLPAGEPLPVDVEIAGDASLAAVREGAFGVERFVDDGGPVVLAVRKRDNAASVRINFRLVASTTVTRSGAPAGDETLTLDVSPDTDFVGEGEGEGEGE
ncbi:MAG: hypothetical protein Q8O67_15210 [Deltaproteobacteria bacterium]|nr:hypothetical protein [Deltaproteobacteria bacterium]